MWQAKLDLGDGFDDVVPILPANPIFNIDVDGVERGLAALEAVQYVVSSRIPGCIPSPEEPLTREAIAQYVLALQIEVAELVQELNWKPWKDAKPLNADRIADEFADILAFLGIMVNHIEHLTGFGPYDLAKQYEAKSRVNWDRLNGRVAGYEGNANGGWKEAS